LLQFKAADLNSERVQLKTIKLFDGNSFRSVEGKTDRQKDRKTEKDTFRKLGKTETAKSRKELNGEVRNFL
jgi:hypothetical protein